MIEPLVEPQQLLAKPGALAIRVARGSPQYADSIGSSVNEMKRLDQHRRGDGEREQAGTTRRRCRP